MNKKSLLLWLLFAAPMALLAQNRTVQGKVTDDTGAPLPSANVTVKGSRQGTQTNKDGNFSLSIAGTGKITLVISHTGYKEAEVSPDASGNVSFQMEKEAAVLEEVVVGYQVVKRKDLTASVSSVTAKQLKDIPLNSAEEALAGRLAGVQVTGSEGSPDAQVLIRVRGGGSITQDNSPLYVVDGIQVDNALSTLSVQDIESISVLKDAAATSIYGARGANGVVIITTKGGKNTGGRTSISYNGYVGINKLTKELGVMDPYNYNYYQFERYTQANDTASLRAFYPNGISDVKNSASQPAFDWQKKMLGRNAFQQTHNVSVSGGTEQTQYDLSVSDNKSDGVMLNSDYDRKLVNFRFDQKANDKVKIGATIRYNNTIIDGAGTSNPGSSSLNFMRQILRYKPFLSAGGDDAYDASFYALTAGNSLNLVNPILLNNAMYRRNYQNVLDLSAYVSYNITRFLTFKSTLGYDYFDLRQTAFDDTLTSNARQNGNLPLAAIQTTTRATINNSNVFTLSMANMNGRFKENNSLDLLLGEETYQTKEKDYNIETRYFPVGIAPESALGNMSLGNPPPGSIEPKPVTAIIPTTQLSFFARANYDFRKKYYLSASIRADGSSLFGQDNRWGYFPSAAVAWRVSSEDFMKDINWLNDLKIRAALGEAGNNRIQPFLYLTQFGTSAQSPNPNTTSLIPVGYGLGDVIVTGFAPTALTNQNLKWETTISRNLGIDAGLFNNRLLISLDLYSNSTKDLLVNVPVPSTSGYTTQIQNVGSTTNKGVELQLSGTIMQRKKFNWSANFNISFNQNRITSLGSQQSYLQNSGWAGSNNPPDFIVKVGEPVGSMWGLTNDGMYTVNDFNYNASTRRYTLKPGVANDSTITGVSAQPGMVKYKDFNGDSLITDKDRTILGVAQPKFFGGFGQNFSYSNWDISVFINFQYGNKVYNYNKLEFTNGYTPGANLLDIASNRWKTVDQNGFVYQQVRNGQVIGASPDSLTALNKGASFWIPLVSNSANSFLPQSWVVEDASFIRINNITVGYSLPPSITRKLKISRLRIYGTVNNVATITGYSGYDPEVNTRRGTPLTPGVDYSAYPRSRSFLAGINLTF